MIKENKLYSVSISFPLPDGEKILIDEYINVDGQLCNEKGEIIPDFCNDEFLIEENWFGGGDDD
ncbi:hypothetical protein [Peribacillus asahii]|uniref:hypothetical protein n=1 Tax=Peribacillus asahii TaxID=228899 RepID=UPI0037FE12F6